MTKEIEDYRAALAADLNAKREYTYTYSKAFLRADGSATERRAFALTQAAVHKAGLLADAASVDRCVAAAVLRLLNLGVEGETARTEDPDDA